MTRLTATRFSFLLAVAALFSGNIAAQIPAKGQPLKQHDLYADRLCRSYFVNVALDVEKETIRALNDYLRQLIPHLKHEDTRLRLESDIISPGGRHFTFVQRCKDMPVFHSQVKVNVDKTNRVQSVFDNSWDASSWNVALLKQAFDNLDETAVAGYFIKKHAADIHAARSRKVIAVISGRPVALVETQVFDPRTDEHYLYLADNAMNIYLRRDLNSYRNSATASAFIYHPDPLTTAKASYGSPYVDNDDNDSPELTAARLPVTIDVTLDNGVYVLENDYVRLEDFSQPDVAPATSLTPAFEFTRAQSGFEDVNILYHITRYQHYIQSLGFFNLSNVQISVDAHALNGNDQSMFTPFILGMRLFFGEGGVDDGEDADVIVHEYGHSLSYSAAPNTNTGSERNAVDEGLCDYLATSYSRDIDEFRWQDMFTWDGHNEYWAGRKANTTKKYRENLTSSIHANGEIYCAALMQIYEGVGREKSDKLLLQSLYSLAANMSMKDAAMLLYDADTALFQGENFCVIYAALLARGLTDTFPGTQACKKIDSNILVSAGDDKIICAGDSVFIGDPSVFSSNFLYSWMPDTGLGTPLRHVTAALPPSDTFTYTLTASLLSGSYNTATVTIITQQCNIRVLNTEGFRAGQPLIVAFPYNSDVNSVELFDVSGKRLFRYTGLPQDNFTMDGALLQAGVYLLRIQSASKKKIQKIVKLL